MDLVSDLYDRATCWPDVSVVPVESFRLVRSLVGRDTFVGIAYEPRKRKTRNEKISSTDMGHRFLVGKLLEINLALSGLSTCNSFSPEYRNVSIFLAAQLAASHRRCYIARSSFLRRWIQVGRLA
jgi:hypothetical protein